MSNLADREALVQRLVEQFDHHDPQLGIDVLPDVYRGLLARDEVVRSDANGGVYLAVRYNDLVAAARNPKVFSTEGGTIHPRPEGMPKAIPIEFDGPLHAAYRKLFTGYMTPSRSNAARPFVRDLCKELLDDFIEGPENDFVRVVARQLPIRTVGHLLGWEIAASPELTELAATFYENHGNEVGAEAGAKLAAAAAADIADRRANPRDDVMSEIVHAEVDGRPLTDDELGNIFRTYVFAGFETTNHVIASLVHYLAEHPERQDQLRADPELIPLAVEEGLRLFPAAQVMARTVTAPITFGGHDMKPGDKLMMCYAAANRDAAKFPDPESFELRDPADGPHVAFGMGAHFCAGAALARVEMQVLLEEMLGRGTFEVDGQVQHAPHLMMGQMMGVDFLPLRFRPAT